MTAIDLLPLSERDLVLIEPWFDDLETQRWLGGREWPSESLRLADPASGRHVLKALRHNTLVGMVDIEAEADGRASFAIVVDPQRRRGGIGGSILRAVQSYPLLRDRSEFYAGVEVGNDASEKLLLAEGFERHGKVDPDGFQYFRLRLKLN